MNKCHDGNGGGREVKEVKNDTAVCFFVAERPLRNLDFAVVVVDHLCKGKQVTLAR